MPVSLVPTAARPDIVIIQGKDVQLLELTVPINTKDGFQAARERKQTKPNYIALINDLEAMVMSDYSDGDGFLGTMKGLMEN